MGGIRGLCLRWKIRLLKSGKLGRGGGWGGTYGGRMYRKGRHVRLLVMMI